MARRRRWRCALLFAAAARADFGPHEALHGQQKRQQRRRGNPADLNSASLHGEERIDAALRDELVAGVGCWWEGDHWDAVVECCGCGECDRSWMQRCCDWHGRWAARCCPCHREFAMAP
mmetsp:Transcript_11852/g.35311  ORF Transcript_11852/g.35311 Transcript_11852/m.35311 type:complete len:119 (+) Transcript_11852:248-604(+)